MDSQTSLSFSSSSSSTHSEEDVDTSLLDESLVTEALRVETSRITHAASHSLDELSDTDDGLDSEKGGAQGPGTIASRAYQLEMLDMSLRRNVIVAMDTGSGKTQVAVLRIRAELDKGAPNKLIWFLAPTTALCAQQFEVLKLQIASVEMRLLIGSDKVDTWSGRTWKTILDGTRVMVTTFQILADALVHGFVKIGEISLLVLDEAHNCVGRHPGTLVMNDFYYPAKRQGQPVPAILGLTASPIMKSRVRSITSLEETLDAVCASPTLHREELLKHVNKPQLKHFEYQSALPCWTPTMQSLHKVHMGMDITKDPYVVRLTHEIKQQHEGYEKSYRALASAIEKHDTFAQKQMDGLLRRSRDIEAQLGSWAAEHYIKKAVDRFFERRSGDELFHQWIDEEKKYLAETLRKIDVYPPPKPPLGRSDISSKVKLLINVLLSFQGNAVGIVFVKERATTTILLELLSLFPAISDRYRMDNMVGSSTYDSRRKNIYEFDERPDVTSVENFRSGKVNLLIATSVLEEGIDVPACNLVVCFDTPSNLKSFIQRRGRARMRLSSLVLLHNTANRPDWEVLEREMKKQYEDEERELRNLELLEDSENMGSRSFTVEATGARLGFDHAKSHLAHFCQVLSGGREFLDSRPDYIIHPLSGDGIGPPSLRATVLLPSFLPAGLRRADSASTWQSEKNATKDAAFQAYIMLYKAGLVNDNLLPFRPDDIPGVDDEAPEAEPEPETRDMPWRWVAEAWQESSDIWLYPVALKDRHGTRGRYNILLPVQLPLLQPLRIYRDHNTEWEVSFGPATQVADDSNFADQTSALIDLHYGHRFEIEDRVHVIKVTTSGDEKLSQDQIGSLPFDPQGSYGLDQMHFIRGHGRAPCSYLGVIPSKPPIEEVRSMFHGYEEAPEDVPYVVLGKWTRRSDFLHRPPEPSPRNGIRKPYPQVYPVPWASVDTIDRRHAEFGMLLPSIIYRLGIQLTAKKLNSTLIKPVGIPDAELDLIKEAIVSPSAREPVDYERLEFLGDSVLKFCAVIQISADHLSWPEGYLSNYKDRLISNRRLRRAAIVKGLTKFIVLKGFPGRKWRPLYLDTFLGEELPDPAAKFPGPKTMADVVESLVGASYQSGGIARALKCLSIFLNEVNWRKEGGGRQVLYDAVPAHICLPTTLEPVEELIGYSFQKKALLIEAMTHASYVAEVGLQSLERIEFLGDAILDKIIVTRLFNTQPPLANFDMHLLKTSMVNAHFLAFIVLNHGLSRKDLVVAEGEIEEIKTTLPLWKFMRHAAPSIGIEQGAVQNRFEALRDDIIAELMSGTHYPWALLLRMNANKYYSDLFEALLGAVWTDSGSLEVCEQVLERFGILPFLDRMVRDRVHMKHPKEELGVLAMRSKVTYVSETAITAEGEIDHRCKVFLGERLMAEVRDGVTREEAQTKAAQDAVRTLKEERMVM